MQMVAIQNELLFLQAPVLYDTIAYGTLGLFARSSVCFIHNYYRHVYRIKEIPLVLLDISLFSPENKPIFICVIACTVQLAPGRCVFIWPEKSQDQCF